MKVLLVLFTLLFATTIQAQKKTMNFEPSVVFTPQLSKYSSTILEERDSLIAIKALTVAQKERLDSLDIEIAGNSHEWQIVAPGCSWYCSGGNDSIYASSSLDSNSKEGFTALSANDLKYNTAWVEGAEGAGIGEYLEYSFPNKSARITEIKVANGFMKSEKTWSDYNRVKKLKLYVNGKEYGILNLQDSRTTQTFKIGLLGHNMDGSKLVLRFEIQEVYAGANGNLTAITEIYFDGIDVH